MSIYVEVDSRNCNTDAQKSIALEKALKKFKKKIKRCELMLEIQKRQHYVKPSVLKREKKLKSISRNKHRMEQEREKYNG
jgi:small subunit ribosomal protein S21